MSLRIGTTLRELAPDRPGALMRDVLVYVLPGVLLYAAGSYLFGELQGHGLNDWGLAHPDWWAQLQRVFFIFEVYLVLAPALLVGLIHYLDFPGVRPTFRKLYFSLRTLVLVIVLAAVFFILSLFDETFSPVTRPFVAQLGEPVVNALFSESGRQGFWFALVQGLFVTLVSVFAVAPAIFLVGRLSFALVRYVSPANASNLRSWLLTAGPVGAALAILLALTPFVKFVLSHIVGAMGNSYFPVGNSKLLEISIVAFLMLQQLPIVVQMVLIGAIIALVYRQVTDEHRPAVTDEG